MRTCNRLLSCAVLYSCCLVGCVEYTPLFDQKVMMATARHSSADCHRSMSVAWDSLKRGDDLYGVRAHLDAAWRRDPGSYEPYWGWGIFRLVQAERTRPREKAAQYLKDSIRHLSTARKMKSLPEEERFNLDMDIVNSYNGLGACYIQLKDRDLADKALGEAGNILAATDPVAKIEKTRYFELLAYNKFYKGDIVESKAAALRAMAEGAQFPPEFLKDVGVVEDELR